MPGTIPDPKKVLDMLGPSELNGLPIHPLIVHIPVVMVPLSLVGIVAVLIRPAWKRWMLPLVTVALGASVVAIQLAVGSGRELESTLGTSTFIKAHQHLALQARPMVLVFFLLVAGAWYLDRRTPADDQPDGGGATAQAHAAKVVLPLALVVGVLATTWVARTGEAGAKATWQGEIGYSQRVAEGSGDKGGKGGKGDDAGSSTTAASSPSKSGATKVTIADFAFGPEQITVHVGDSVTWTNKDSAKHSAKSRPGEGPKVFTTKPLGQGDSDSITFDKAGDYKYVCGFHTYMKGEVRVLK